MAFGDEAGTFDYVIKGTSITPGSDGQPVLNIQCEGQGQSETLQVSLLIGTLELHGFGVGAQSGQSVWRALAISGAEPLADLAPGIWTLLGPNQIRSRATSVGSGDVLAGDGVVDLAEKTFKGKLFHWP